MEHQDWKPVVFDKIGKLPEFKERPKRPMSKADKLAVTDDPSEIKQKNVVKYGKKIQQLRMTKGMTQKTFANFLNLAESLIKDYEADRIQPEGNIRTRIMRKCNCKL